MGSRRSAEQGDDHFSSDEVDKLRAACRSIQEQLIVVLLATTGLRRQGLLNITVPTIASRDDQGVWRAEQTCETLTKGRKTHEFTVHKNTAACIERWLNTPEAQGGRPMTPSAFLFPSRTVDNGQLSRTSLTNIFKGICKRAGLDKDKRDHPHAMRHTYAHQLLDDGNDITVVKSELGHRSLKTTARYVRESRDATMKKLKTPVSWNQDNNPVQTQAVDFDTDSTVTPSGPIERATDALPSHPPNSPSTRETVGASTTTRTTDAPTPRSPDMSSAQEIVGASSTTRRLTMSEVIARRRQRNTQLLGSGP